MLQVWDMIFHSLGEQGPLLFMKLFYMRDHSLLQQNKTFQQSWMHTDSVFYVNSKIWLITKDENICCVYIMLFARDCPDSLQSPKNNAIIILVPEC